MKLRLAAFGLALLWYASSGAPLVGQAKLTVAAASNLAPITAALAEAFTRQTGDTVEFILGASGTLATQLRYGAPFDVLLSADVETPQRLATEGLSTAPRVYALGKLLLFSLEPRDFSQGLSLLLKPTVTQVALANPQLAPYGRAAVEALSTQGLWAAVQPKVVTAQNVTQALQFTVSGTGLGFIAKSSLFTPDLVAFRRQQGVHWFEVDQRAYAPIEQAFVVRKASLGKVGVVAFVQFLGSQSARAIFEEAGYSVP
ncbi:MAG: molybdate ABC transporter substrate-binding protein [Spirochaetales bacterium]